MRSYHYQSLSENILLDGSKVLYFPGIDFGNCIHKILKESLKYYLIQRNGRTCYLGRSRSVYSVPSYNILTKIAPSKEDKFACENENGIEIEYNRQTKKQAYTDIINKWNELNEV
jgi:hypothetical protein